MATKTKGQAKLKAVQDPPDSKRVKVFKDIKIKLKDKEIMAKAKENGHLQKELDADKDLLTERTKEFKEFKKPQDKKIKDLSERIANINREVETGEAIVRSEVGVVFNYASCEVLTYFPADSNKEADIVERRTMDAKEKQLSLIPEEAQAIAAGIPEEGMEAVE